MVFAHLGIVSGDGHTLARRHWPPGEQCDPPTLPRDWRAPHICSWAQVFGSEPSDRVLNVPPISPEYERQRTPMHAMHDSSPIANEQELHLLALPAGFPVTVPTYSTDLVWYVLDVDGLQRSVEIGTFIYGVPRTRRLTFAETWTQLDFPSRYDPGAVNEDYVAFRGVLEALGRPVPAPSGEIKAKGPSRRKTKRPSSAQLKLQRRRHASKTTRS